MHKAIRFTRRAVWADLSSSTAVLPTAPSLTTCNFSKHTYDIVHTRVTDGALSGTQNVYDLVTKLH